MLFNLKSAFVLSLVAVASAAPIVQPGDSTHDLVARAKIPESVTCKGKTFTQAQIQQAWGQARTRSGKYPASFGNKGGAGVVFPNPGTGQLKEFPLADPHWTTGPPGIYRVVWSEKEKTKTDPKTKKPVTSVRGSFVGVMVKKAGTGEIYEKC